MYRTITREEIRDRMASQQPMHIVEALPPRYFNHAHLPGAINIPHDEVRERAENILPDKEAFIVVYCANTPCANSRIAATTFIQMGYSNVFEYVEGKQDWEDAGYPLEKLPVAQAAQVG